MWFVTIAAAAEPTLVVTDAGTVRGTVVVHAPPERVRALLLDPAQRLATVSGEGTRSTTEVDGACVLEHSDVPHPIHAVSYTVRSCPTATGVRSELVQSDELTRLTSVWTVEAAEGGSRVTYELDAVPSFPLPSFLARASTKGGVYDALVAVARRFGS